MVHSRAAMVQNDATGRSPVLSTWPIRVKLSVGLGVLVLVVGILASSGLYTMYAYRSLAKSLSWRVTELPVAAELSRQVADLRITLSELRGLQTASFGSTEEDDLLLRVPLVRDHFRVQLDQVEDTLQRYRTELKHPLRPGAQIGDNQQELQTVRKIETSLTRIHEANRDENWMLDNLKVGLLESELGNLQMLAADLPSHLHAKLAGFAGEVRGQYRTLIVGTWATSVTAALLFALFMQLSWRWIIEPLHVLIHGSRLVASGQFGHRIHLDTEDEMAELAEAMNAMTDRFQRIRDDLDRQVQERTKQVIRSERLASVGFLAAGVAHEINNPLASIAMCAESLQDRVVSLLERDNPDHQVIDSYLQMVQDEAFRCKEITEKLLDFSRIGQTKRQHADLRELVQDVLDMVKHLGKYQRKRVEFLQGEPVFASVNAPEIKQVVLNLLTNALESIEEDGCVKIDVQQRDDLAELTFRDDGCGIDPDVLEHVFEPFFTRRRAGQGTGLGLSISYRIVADHGGEIQADSPGANQGATFRVRLPLADVASEPKQQVA